MPSPKKKIQDATLEPIQEWERIRNLRIEVPHHVVERRFAAETVLLNAQTGHYYGMDDTGARFFEVLRAHGSPAAALAVLTREFDEEEDRIREDLIRYCSELQSLGLIEWHEAPEA